MGAALLNGCAIPIQEANIYTDAGANGAVEGHLFATDIEYIGKAAWDSMREGYSCVSATDLGNIKSEIEKLCSKTECSEQAAAQIKQAVANLDRAQKAAASLDDK